MIHVRRNTAPAILESKRAAAARKDAAEFFGRPRRKRTGQRHTFQKELWLKVERDLVRLFRGKCAYCDRRLSKTEKFLVDHFRPLADARQLRGPSSSDHYWWLAYEWGNLYPSCPECRKSKKTFFPVKGTRASEGATGEELLKETALLLDPCYDNPEDLLYFMPDGRVYPGGNRRTPDIDAEKAATTIKVLGLNRKSLVKGRAHAWEEVAAVCRAIARRRHRLVAGTGAPMSQPKNRLRKALEPWLPFAAARRQAARYELKAMGGFGEQIMSLVPELSPPRGDESYLRAPRVRNRRTAYVRDVRIENFKAIRKLALKIEDPPDVSVLPLVSWTVFLGENGAGKTSVLQALALALGGEYHVRNIVVNWDKILRRPRGNRKRPREGFVKITLSTGELIDLRFNRRRGWFKSGAEGALTTLRAYGPTRNLPTTRVPASWKSVEAMVRIINLFDSDSPFASAEGWLASRPQSRFEAAALALKNLMQLGPKDGIRRAPRKAYDSARKVMVPIVDIGNSSSRLDELSDGYQSMIALAVDIMAGLPRHSTDIQADTGIVMIDELGNHLHPAWRMQIVSSLRRTFPRIQFIVSTHEPLCLRGLHPGEIVVLRREREDITAQIVTESVAHLRADQLLTSPLFGLGGTRDPEELRKSQDDEQQYDKLFLKAVPHARRGKRAPAVARSHRAPDGCG